LARQNLLGMEPISKATSHNKYTYYYILINFLQKTSFYGVRALVVAHVLFSSLSDSVYEASQFIFTITAVYIICRIVGGLIGDLWLGNKLTAAMGGLVQALGICLLLFSQKSMTYLGIGFISLGAGAFSINLLSMFGKQYLNKSRLLDSAFTMYYASIHFGAMIGSILLGIVAMSNLKIAIIIAALFSACSALLILFLHEVELTQKQLSQFYQYKSRKLILGMTIGFVTLFWFIYQIAGEPLPELKMKFSEDAFFNSMQSSWYSSFNDTFVIIIGIVMSIFWSFNFTKQFSKISIGFLLTGVSLFIIMLFPNLDLNSGNVMVLASMLFMAAGEIIIAPIVCSAITKFSDTNYLAINMSLARLPILFLTFIYAKMKDGFFAQNTSSVKIIAMILVCVAIISFFTFNFLNTHRSRQKMIEE
jgi:proton-dependent oligopeptide transporter, POT family